MPEIILPFFTKNLDKKNMESIIKGAFKKKKKIITLYCNILQRWVESVGNLRDQDTYLKDIFILHFCVILLLFHLCIYHDFLKN